MASKFRSPATAMKKPASTPKLKTPVNKQKAATRPGKSGWDGYRQRSVEGNTVLTAQLQAAVEKAEKAAERAEQAADRAERAAAPSKSKNTEPSHVLRQLASQKTLVDSPTSDET